MNPLFMTLAFLSLISLLTASEMANAKRSTTLFSIHAKAVSQAEEMEKAKALASLEELRSSKEGVSINKKIEKLPLGKKKEALLKTASASAPPSLNFSNARPPNNSRLNLYPLVHAPSSDVYEQAASLMRILYSKAPFFAEHPNLEYCILDTLIKEKERCETFLYPDELSSLHLPSSALQRAFYLMMKGGESYPSLLNYITFDSTKRLSLFQRRLNIMFASKEVLLATLQNEELALDLIKAREPFLQLITEQEKNRKQMTKEEWKGRGEIKKMVKARCIELLESKGFGEFAKRLDYSLGQKGNILLIEDPKSGQLLREKVSLQGECKRGSLS